MAYSKTISTYLDGFSRIAVTGMLFPNFNNCQTVTGRLSSSNPNMQNVSKRNKFGKDLHSLFIAPEGWTCVQIDFAQLEVWVLAWLSGDKKLQKDLLNNVDLHCKTVSYYNDVTYEEAFDYCKVQKLPEWVAKRSEAKGPRYQMSYGAMPKSISRTTGMPIATVEKIMEKEKESYPKAMSLGDYVRQEAQNNMQPSYAYNIPYAMKKGSKGARIGEGGIELLPIFDKSNKPVYNQQYVRFVGYWQSPTGKKYHFLETGRKWRGQINGSISFTQTKNYPMQGTAADIQGVTSYAVLKACLTRPDKIKMINEVHDSKWFYVKSEELDTIIPWLVKVIEDVPKLFKERFDIDVPFKFPVDVEVGPNFADMQEYKVW
jgi:DNA polymerase I-like protein with 3'-5' exonuclease and polymerase domains